MTIPALIERKGELCLPNGDALYRFLPSGDVGGFNWPGDFLAEELREALYDAREMGEIGNASEVTLPDGTTFLIG